MVRILVICLAAIAMLASPVLAQTKKGGGKKSPLAKVCPKIREIGSDVFWKNNKPIRASSAFAAPVIGYNKVMTFAYQKGSRGPLASVATLYDSLGKSITQFKAFPCRPDHCGGRVVSSMLTATARRTAISRTKKPTGYLKISSSLCVKIKDLGLCHNVQRRGPCLEGVK